MDSWKLIWQDWRLTASRQLDQHPYLGIVAGLILVTVCLITVGSTFYLQGQNLATLKTIPQQAIMTILAVSFNLGFWIGLAKIKREANPHLLPDAQESTFWKPITGGWLISGAISLLIALPTLLGYSYQQQHTPVLVASLMAAIVILSGLMMTFGVSLAVGSRLLGDAAIQVVVGLISLWAVNSLLLSPELATVITRELASDQALRLVLIAVGSLALMTLLVSFLDSAREELPDRPSVSRCFNMALGRFGLSGGFGQRSCLFLAALLRLIRSQAFFNSLIIGIGAIVVGQLILPDQMLSSIWWSVIVGVSLILLTFQTGFAAGWQTLIMTTQQRYLPIKPQSVIASLYLASLAVAVTVGFAFCYLAFPNSAAHQGLLLGFVVISHGCYFYLGKISSPKSQELIGLVVSLILLAVTLNWW